MSGILSQPFPRESSFRKTFYRAAISACIVTVFLFVFRPFGFEYAPVRSLKLFAAGYGLVTFTVVILSGIFEIIFPRIFLEEKWTVGKNIILYIAVVFLIACANLFYTSATTGMRINSSTFISFLLTTLSVTVIVVSVTTMLKYFRSMKFYKKEAEKIQTGISEADPFNTHVTISFKSENERERLDILADDLYFIEAADNYSKIVYRNEGEIKSTLIRTTLKKLEEQIADPRFFRCHRSFIVQLRNVKKISGNSQGYRLHYNGMKETVPVSRSSSDEMKRRLNGMGENRS